MTCKRPLSLREIAAARWKCSWASESACPGAARVSGRAASHKQAASGELMDQAAWSPRQLSPADCDCRSGRSRWSCGPRSRKPDRCDQPGKGRWAPGWTPASISRIVPIRPHAFWVSGLAARFAPKANCICEGAHRPTSLPTSSGSLSPKRRELKKTIISSIRCWRVLLFWWFLH